MMDATALNVAGVDPVVGPIDKGDSPTAETVTGREPAREDSGAVASAACAVCQEAFGDRAVASAEAVGASPVLALTICTSMQRMVRRAFEARATTPEGYLAYVLLGAGRSRASREADLEALAETMW